MTLILKWLAVFFAPALLAGVVVVSPVDPSSVPRNSTYDVASASSVTTLMLDGTYGFGFEGKMDNKLQRALCLSPYDCVNVEYNRWVFAPISAGTRAFDQAVTSVAGNMVGFGYSRGAMAAQEWIDENTNNPFAPSAEELKFVFIGNPYRKYGGSEADKGQKLSTGDYDILDISVQYDSVSDAPDRHLGSWFARMLARSNAKFSTHLTYDEVDLSRPDLLVYTEEDANGRKTTYVLIPTDDLPILDGIRWWAPKLADRIQEQWKPLIESTYDRSMFNPAGPGGVQLPFADEESTSVQMMADEPIDVSSPTPPPARTAQQNVAPKSEPELVIEEDIVEDSNKDTMSSESIESETSQEESTKEPEPELEPEAETEKESDRKSALSNEAEEEAELEKDLEAALDDDDSLKDQSEESPDKERRIISSPKNFGNENDDDSESDSPSDKDDDKDSPDSSNDD